MRLPNAPNVHLTYCLNIHRGETWPENLAAIRDKALAVKAIVSPDRPFGLGLRVSNAASLQLAEPKALDEFRAFLKANGLYVFTINGFPFGGFHDGVVKDEVYKPDWSSRARYNYTERLAFILAALIPEGVAGSISTVPVTYKPWGRRWTERNSPERNLCIFAGVLAKVFARTGKEILLALEPEPDCFIETTAEAIAFFKGLRERFDHDEKVCRHLGICVDVCHLAVEFEDPAASIERLTKAGVVVPKVQLSSALRLKPSRTTRRKLAEFNDPVYLHQVKARKANGEIVSYRDLPDVPEIRGVEGPAGEEWRVHFHVPLYFSEYGELQSTRDLYTPALAKLLASGVTPHLEIETYTFDVLPPAARESDVVKSIAREFEWVLAWLGS